MAITLQAGLKNAKERKAILDKLEKELSGCIALSQVLAVPKEKADLIKLLEEDDALKPNKMASNMQQFEQIYLTHLERFIGY